MRLWAAAHRHTGAARKISVGNAGAGSGGKLDRGHGRGAAATATVGAGPQCPHAELLFGGEPRVDASTVPISGVLVDGSRLCLASTSILPLLPISTSVLLSDVSLFITVKTVTTVTRTTVNQSSNIQSNIPGSKSPASTTASKKLIQIFNRNHSSSNNSIKMHRRHL